MRRALIGVIVLGCTACTTDAYQPGVGQLTSAAEAVGAVVSDDAVELRQEYRISLLSRGAAGSSISPAKFVCEPLAYTAAPLGSSGEVAAFGSAAADVAAPPKPSFWNGIAGLFTSYELPPPRNKKELQTLASGTLDDCEKDVAGVPGVNQFLEQRVSAALGAEARSMGDAVSGIIDIVGPAVTEALTVVDEHRRAAALRTYFSDGDRVKLLYDHIDAVTKFAETMDQYRRLRAMESVTRALQAVPAGADEATAKAAIDAAGKYDVAYAAQLKPAFATMAQSVKDLERIAKGEDSAELIRSSFRAARRTLYAIECLQELTNDKAKKKKLQSLIDKLTGHKPKPPNRNVAPAGSEPAEEGSGG